MRLLVQVYFIGSSRNNHIPITVGYRPHLAMHYSDYLMGVEFIEFLDTFSFDCSIGAIVEILYVGVDYSSLCVGTEFDIREGRHVVGYGKVIERE